VWEFTQEMNNEHPAAFPVDLILRVISSTSASVVLDPFMGSGTTAIAARTLKRAYIGIEISPQYCEMAENRLERDKLRREIVVASQSPLFSIQNENIYKGRID
jgi:modification methylase